MVCKNNLSQDSGGFVLPNVLIVIAVLSISLMLVAQRLQNTSRLMMEIESQFSGNIALNSAEAEAIYSLLTSVPVTNGFELNPEGEGDLFSAKKERIVPPDIWSAKGSLRKSNTPKGTVVVEFRDGSGFIPINSIDEDSIRALTRSLGVSSSKEQNSLTAKLLDYIDEDVRRKVMGGERADYRLRQMPIPTNSSLRKIGELDNIMEWNELLDEIGYRAVLDRVTLNPMVKTVKKNFLEPLFAEQLGMEFAAKGDIYNILMLDNYPTDVARFTFYYQNSNGKIMRRKTEVSRTVALLHKPFSRQLLYEDTIPYSDSNKEENRLYSNLDRSKHVIYAETYRHK